jgi:hypothetical protein
MEGVRSYGDRERGWLALSMRWLGFPKTRRRSRAIINESVSKKSTPSRTAAPWVHAAESQLIAVAVFKGSR